MKTCPACGETKPRSEYYSAGRNSLQTECKPCKQAYQRRTQTADTRRLAKYGLCPAQFQALLRAQFRACQICKTPFGMLTPHALHVDHDHTCCPGPQTCGKCVRGLLCCECNRGLGKFQDDVRALESAARYLRRSARA